MRFPSAMLLVLAIFVVGAWPIHGAGLFDFSQIPEAQRNAQKAVFDKALQNWISEQLEQDPFQLFFHIDSYFTGQAFIDLVSLGPAIAPYLIETIQKERTVGVLKNEGFDRYYEGALSYLMNGALECRKISLGSSIHIPDIHWSNDIPRQFEQLWDTRRKAFDDKRKKAAPAYKGPLPPEEDQEWNQLVYLGLYGVPSVMKRIQTGKSDIFDIHLLNLWTEPVVGEMRTFTKFKGGMNDRIQVPCPERKLLPVSDYIIDPAYWLRWWETKKADFWWLIAK